MDISSGGASVHSLIPKRDRRGDRERKTEPAFTFSSLAVACAWFVL